MAALSWDESPLSGVSLLLSTAAWILRRVWRASMGRMCNEDYPPVDGRPESREDAWVDILVRDSRTTYG